MRALLLCMHGGGREGGATPSREGRGIIRMGYSQEGLLIVYWRSWHF